MSGARAPAAVELLRDILDGLGSQPARVGLSVFAIAVGTMVFAVLIMIVQGLERRAEALTREFGADVVSIDAQGDPARSADTLRVDHADLLRANFPDFLVSPLRGFRVEALGRPGPLEVYAAGPELAAIRGWRLTEGRFLDELDYRARARVLVAGEGLRQESGWAPGSVVLLDSVPFTVVGVVAAGSPLMNGSVVDLAAMIPHTGAGPLRGERPDYARRTDRLLVRVAGGVDVERAQRDFETLFAQPGVAAGKLSFSTARDLVEGLRRLGRSIVLSAGSVALLCLLLGGTTLMSLMVANVRERVPEIGLRLALGARRSQVSTLFVAEATLVTVAAGVLGTAAGHALTGLIGSQLPVAIEPGTASLLAPTAVALMLGVLFAWWPARSAARVSPSEALRAE